MDTPLSRRRALRTGLAAGGLTAGAWVAPQILTVPLASAQVMHYLQLDPSTCASIATTNPTLIPTCVPAGWTAGLPAVVNGVDVSWTLVENNGSDCTQGFSLTVTTPGCTIVGGQAEEVCPLGSPPSTNCVVGTLSLGNTRIDFPDNSVPDGCTYVSIRIVLDCPTS